MGSEDGRPGTGEERLERQRERVAALQHVVDLLREVHRAAVRASTREELHRAVCETLAEPDGYVLAWLGEQDPTAGEIVPLASQGRDGGDLDAVAVPVGDGDPRGPAAEAIETGEVRVVTDVQTDPRFDQWRDRALDRGYRSLAAIPVLYEETVYGVLVVYADRPDAFDERERTVLGEVGETVGLAAGAIERRRGLVADGVLEVDLAIADHAVVDVCAATDATLTLCGVVAESGDEFRYYYDVTGDADAVATELVGRIDRIRRARVLDGSRLEVATDDSVLTAWLSDHGGTVVAGDVDAERIRVTVEFPQDAEMRRIVEAMPFGMTLLAQRMSETTAVTRERFRERVTERLTERQHTVLRSAYLAGYHDRPRTVAGEDVAATLGISRSTFHQHHRVGVRKLLAAAFERPGDGDVPE